MKDHISGAYHVTTATLLSIVMLLFLSCSRYVTVDHLDPESLTKAGLSYDCIRDIQNMTKNGKLMYYLKVKSGCKRHLVR